MDPERKRIVLTAKKTLVESNLPIVSQLSDAQVGVVTHAVVFKVSDKSLQVEFYNNLKAVVPVREARWVVWHLDLKFSLNIPDVAKPPWPLCLLLSLSASPSRFASSQ